MFHVRQVFFFFFLPGIIKCGNCETEKHLASGGKVNVAFNVGLLSAERETRLIMIKTEPKLMVPFCSYLLWVHLVAD